MRGGCTGVWLGEAAPESGCECPRRDQTRPPVSGASSRLATIALQQVRSRTHARTRSTAHMYQLRALARVTRAPLACQLCLGSGRNGRASCVKRIQRRSCLVLSERIKPTHVLLRKLSKKTIRRRVWTWWLPASRPRVPHTHPAAQRCGRSACALGSLNALQSGPLTPPGRQEIRTVHPKRNTAQTRRLGRFAVVCCPEVPCRDASPYLCHCAPTPGCRSA